MHLPFNLNQLLKLVNQADRVAKDSTGTSLQTIFAAVNTVSLGVISTKMVMDMLHDRKERRNAHHHDTRHDHDEDRSWTHRAEREQQTARRHSR